MNIFDTLIGKLFDKLNIKAFNRDGISSQNQAKINNSSIGVFHQSNDRNVYLTVGADKNLNTFLLKIENSHWSHQQIKSSELYTCLDDSSYQIEIGEKSQPFNEPWSDVYPDKNNSWLIPVYLKINGQCIKEIDFVLCDGGKIFVPLPVIADEKISEFYWNRNTLEFKLSKIIGVFYKYDGIEGVAKKSGIQII